MEVEESEDLLSTEYIKKGMAELPVGATSVAQGDLTPAKKSFRVGNGHTARHRSSHIPLRTRFRGVIQ